MAQVHNTLEAGAAPLYYGIRVFQLSDVGMPAADVMLSLLAQVAWSLRRSSPRLAQPVFVAFRDGALRLSTVSDTATTYY